MTHWIRWSLAALAAIALVGCTGGVEAKQNDSPESSGGASKVAEAPTGDDKLSGDLEVAAFKGGYGIDFYEACAKAFEGAHPKVKIKIWGDPRVWEQLRPKFASGTPPSLVFPGWGMDHWALVEENQILALDAALDSKSADGDGTWRSTFDPNLLKLCQQDGHTWVLPYYVMTYGWWYDENVFTANGWTAPKTWDELLALNTKIKAKGMAPITFQGKYPYYMIEGMLMPWTFSVGGVESVRAAQNLDPGAWDSEPVLKAAQMIDDLNKSGAFENGAVGLSHTESQMDLLLGKAAMIPCGSWIEAEMSKQMDEIAKSGKPRPKLRFFLPPVVNGGKGDPTNVLIGIEPWMVTAKGGNANAAVALFKFMTSKANAKAFVKGKGTLMSVKGAEESDLPEGLKAPAAAMKGAGILWANQCRSWYPEFNKEIENALTALLNKEITPKQFCERVEKKAAETRDDGDIKKHKVAF